MVAFLDVQNVLTGIIKTWTDGNGGTAPDLMGQRTHRTAMFAWDTKDHLLNSSARGLPLIQPELKGKVGQGKTANIVVALTAGVNGFPPMPFGGLDSSNGVYLQPDSPQIQTLIEWIEAGFPD